VKPKVRLKWLFVLVAAVALAMAGLRTWVERNDPILRWRRMLRWGSPAERYRAVEVLGLMKDPRAIPDLLGVLEGTDESIRPIAARAIHVVFRPRGLGNAGIDRVPDKVIVVLKGLVKDDPAAAVRCASIESLGILAGASPEIRPFLLARLDDPGEDGRVRAAAYDCFKLEWRYSGEGLRYCSDPAPEVRRVAYRGLFRAIPLADLVDLVVRGLDDPDLQVRYIAIRLIPADFRGAPGPWWRALPGVFAALDDPYDYVRWDACRALRGLTAGTERAPRAMAALRDRLASDGDRDRAAAADALAGFGADAVAVIPALVMAGARPRPDELGMDRRYERLVGAIAAAWLAAHPPSR
jgi:HEAT repeat protein